jgi:hypothetical protein
VLRWVPACIVKMQRVLTTAAVFMTALRGDNT